MTDETKDTQVEEKVEETTQDSTPEETTEETPAEEATTDAPADDAGEEVEVPEKFKSIVDAIENMSVLDLHELVQLFEKKFGVSAVAVAAAGAGAAGAEEAEEKSEYTVHLANIGDNKIKVIKAVKTALGLGLKEAKELVEAAPADLKAGVAKEDAEALKTEIEEAGGSVELK